jgi:hypothetical protein
MSPCHPERSNFASRSSCGVEGPLPDFPALLNWGANVLLRMKHYVALLAVLRVREDDNF